MLLLWVIAYEQPGRPNPAEELDEGLISQIAQGDTEALSQLYTATKTAVYGFALSMLRNPAAAEDVMQDTYIRIFQAAGSYRSQGKPMAWILTIVRNLSLMWLRSPKEGAPSLDEIPTAATGEKSFERQSLDSLILDAALGQLTDSERQVVILHSVTGLKHREIAVLLELPLSTTLSKYNRALKKLRNFIEKGEG